MEQKQEQRGLLRMTPEVSAAILADRCRRDGELSKRVCEDPKAVVAVASGRTLPESTKVVVHRNSADHWHIAIPTDAQARTLNDAWEGSGAGDSLTDEQLQAISGGLEIWIAALVLAGSAIATGALVGGVLGGSRSASSVQGQS